jgi:hypothetical protein
MADTNGGNYAQQSYDADGGSGSLGGWRRCVSGSGHYGRGRSFKKGKLVLTNRERKLQRARNVLPRRLFFTVQAVVRLCAVLLSCSGKASQTLRLRAIRSTVHGAGGEAVGLHQARVGQRNDAGQALSPSPHSYCPLPSPQRLPSSREGL